MIRRPLGRHEQGGIGNRGFGLVEVMVALSILGLALAYSTRVQGGAMALIEANQNSMTATADLQAAMEQVLLQTHDNIPVNFPAGVPIAAFTDLHLPNQLIVPTYPQGAAANPLEIQLTLSFTDVKHATDQPRTMTLFSMKAR